MLVEFKKLLRLLEKECEYQDWLLGLLSKERQAIVELNREKIVKINDEKNKVLEKAREIEQTRQDILRFLVTDLSPGAESKLANILERCPNAETKSELSRVSLELKNMAKSVREINNHNAELIKQSMGIISSVIAILRSTPEADLPTYTENGSLSNNNEDPAFAKRSNSFVREV